MLDLKVFVQYNLRFVTVSLNGNLDGLQFFLFFRRRWKDVTVVDPDFNSHLTHYRVGFGQGVINVRSQGVQRHTAHHKLFNTRNLRTGDTPFDYDFYAFGSTLHRPLGCLTHGSAIGYPALHLLGDVAGDIVLG